MEYFNINHTPAQANEFEYETKYHNTNQILETLLADRQSYRIINSVDTVHTSAYTINKHVYVPLIGACASSSIIPIHITILYVSPSRSLLARTENALQLLVDFFRLFIFFSF